MSGGSKYVRRVIVFGGCALIIALGVYNFRNNTDFLNASFVNCFSLFVAICISYVFVQRRADEKNQKDIFLRLLQAMQAEVNERKAYHIELSDDIREMTMRKRTLNNYVKIMGTYADKFGVEEEACFIRERIDEYSELLGNHLMDLQFLSESENDLWRPLNLVNDKLYDTMLKLFQ